MSGFTTTGEQDRVEVFRPFADLAERRRKLRLQLEEDVVMLYHSPECYVPTLWPLRHKLPAPRRLIDTEGLYVYLTADVWAVIEAAVEACI